MKDDTSDARFVSAGIGCTAGSNRIIFSNPAQELGALTPVIEESNRRWRDDEFLISRALPRGLSRIRVRFQVAPTGNVLLPGDVPPRPSAWSEVRYSAYSWSLPKP